MVVLAALLVAGGCSRGGSSDGAEKAKQVALEPRFAPETTVAGGTAVPPASTTTVGRGGAASPTTTTPAAGGAAASTTTSAAAAGASGAGAPITPTSASIEDRQFDTTPSVLDPAPPWADLVAARLTRTADGYELRVRVRGDAAPKTSGDDAHTMNIGSFYDVDGNGSIDYEVWLNVASGGWGASYFDNTGGGKGGFQEKSGVTVGPEGTEVVARFPLAHLKAAERFRWSLGSEWGRYEVIGSAAAARDDLPDDNQPARFPGS